MQLAMGSLSPGDIKALAICTIFIFAVLGAIIVALLDHQRKMAEIIRSDRKQGDDVNERVDALQNDIRELKSLLSARIPATSEDIQQRVS